MQIGWKFTELRALEYKKYAIAETRDPPDYLYCKKLEDGGKRSLSNVIPLVGIRANKIRLLKCIISCDHSQNSLTLHRSKNSGSKQNRRETESVSSKHPYAWQLAYRIPVWIPLVSPWNNWEITETTAYGNFTKKCYFEASGFSFRTNLNFKSL